MMDWSHLSPAGGAPLAGKTSEIYDPESQTWMPGPDLPFDMYYITLLNINDQVYSFGGLTPGFQNRKIYVLRSDLTQWDEFPRELPFDLAEGRAVAYNLI